MNLLIKHYYEHKFIMYIVVFCKVGCSISHLFENSAVHGFCLSRTAVVRYVPYFYL